MLNEMMGDPEANLVIHWHEFECDEFDYYVDEAWKVNCLKCKQRLTPRAADEVPECDCNSAFGFHEAGCAISIYRAALRR